MTDIKQPEDRKTKATKFTFASLDGEIHTLPLASEGSAKLTGRDIRDAAMGGEMGQMTYLFKLLEAAGPDEDALDALYELPQDDMLEVLRKWGEHGDGDGASLGK